MYATKNSQLKKQEHVVLENVLDEGHSIEVSIPICRYLLNVCVTFALEVLYLNTNGSNFFSRYAPSAAFHNLFTSLLKWLSLLSVRQAQQWWSLHVNCDALKSPAGPWRWSTIPAGQKRCGAAGQRRQTARQSHLLAGGWTSSMPGHRPPEAANIHQGGRDRAAAAIYPRIIASLQQLQGNLHLGARSHGKIRQRRDCYVNILFEDNVIDE